MCVCVVISRYVYIIFENCLFLIKREVRSKHICKFPSERPMNTTRKEITIKLRPTVVEKLIESHITDIDVLFEIKLIEKLEMDIKNTLDKSISEE